MSEQRPITWPQELEEALRRDLPAFDWDGQIRPLTAEITPIVEPHYRRVCEIFWRHYLAHPATAHVRDYYTPEQLAQEIATSTAYMRAKFENPLGREWMEMACTNARHSDRAASRRMSAGSGVASQTRAVKS